MINQVTYDAIMKNRDQIDSAIIYERDFHYVSIQYQECVPLSTRRDSLTSSLSSSSLTELLWIQDFGKILSSTYQWKGS